jgi:Fur family transcriptional regulator, peroxide stress response regulator
MSAANSLRERGIRPSHQRIRIFEALLATTAHPSAEAIYQGLSSEMPTLSRTTVYSTLDLLAEKGLAQRLPISGSELRYDADTSPHVHFHCRCCGGVFDLRDANPPAIPTAPEGYRIEFSQFYAEGLCPACSASPVLS